MNMKSVHGEEYDRLVRQLRVASQHSRTADARSTATMMMMTTTTESPGSTGSIEVIKVNYDDWARIQEKRVEINTLLSKWRFIRITNGRENGRHERSFFFFCCLCHVFHNHFLFLSLFRWPKKFVKHNASPHAIQKRSDHMWRVRSCTPWSRSGRHHRMPSSSKTRSALTGRISSLLLVVFCCWLFSLSLSSFFFCHHLGSFLFE